jgi:hypothetical protein
MIDTASERENLAGNYAGRAYEARLHTADPGTTGANEVTGGAPAYARIVIAWNAGAVDGIHISSDLAFNVPEATDLAFVSLWRQDGTYMDKAPITGSFVNQGIHHVVLTYTQE